MIFFAGMDFFLAALNVYYGINGTGNTALNWAAAVFVFGIGLIQIAFYIIKALDEIFRGHMEKNKEVNHEQ